jgi:amidophosphoribosyltransferase
VNWGLIKLDGLKEECGIFGIYSVDRGLDKTKCSYASYYALMALQHRGQEACGIAVNMDRNLSYHKSLGLVDDTFNEEILDRLVGDMAIGHVRYSADKTPSSQNAQPLVLNYIKGSLAISHNGNIINADLLRKEYERTGAIYQTTSDTEIIAYTIARERINSKSIEEAVELSMHKLKGAYSLVIMSPQKIIAARDPWGLKPLCIGTRGNDIVFASESCAFDAIGAKFLRDVEPGEVVVAYCGKMSSLHYTGKSSHNLCIFEYIYFARPDSMIENQFVYESRKIAGRILAKESFVNGDIVIGVPDSGIPAAIGFSEESNIPYAEGFLKNRYIARTFIKSTQGQREKAVRLKLNPLKEYVRGKRVIMIDDSIVRGTTCKHIVNLLREAGAEEVHVKISSPPFINPCFYGTDIPSKKDLVANSYTIDETRELIKADSLAYLSLDNLEKIAPNVKKSFCKACFNGEYPIL